MKPEGYCEWYTVGRIRQHMHKLLAFVALFACITQAQTTTPKVFQAFTTGSQADFISRRGIIFIYEGNADPCAPNAVAPLPIGRGFVFVVPSRSPTPTGQLQFGGYRFLFTAEHVVHGRPNVMIRYNMSTGQGFGCSKVFMVGEFTPIEADPNMDLVAVRLNNDIPNFAPFGFSKELLADDDKLKGIRFGEGTDVFTSGYLLGSPGNISIFH